MPKLEQGDLESVKALKDRNIPPLAKLAREGYAILTPVPSCTLMFKQELPLMFPGDEDVKAVRDAMFDPFEYLMARRRDGLLKTEFPKALGKVAYHVPCHTRVQKIGPEDEGGAGGRARHRGADDRALLGTRGHVGREEPNSTRPRSRSAGPFSARSPISRPTISPPIARWPATTSRKASARIEGAPHPQLAHPITLFEWPMDSRTDDPMAKITRESLMTLEAYAKARKEFRAKVIAHKKARTCTWAST